MAILLGTLLAVAPAEAGEHQLGLGAHFWKTVDNIVDDASLSNIDEDGYAAVASYRYQPGGIFFFQIDLDYYANGYGGSTADAYTPMIFLGAGRNWYLAVGIGATYSSDFNSDSFYVGRIGKNFDLLPGISLDINATYEIDSFSEFDQLRSDSTTLGAVVRFTL